MHNKVVCTYKPTFNSYDSHWKKAGIDFTYLTDNTKQKLDVGLTYTEQDLRDTFNFTGEVSKTHFYNHHGNRTVVWFYAHFRMMYYYLKYPNYPYYWFFDDDVTIKDWDLFFKAFENNNSDFISYYCFKEESVTSQPYIPNIDSNTNSGNSWFMRFPGHGDIVPETKEYFGSFYPITRFSNMALKKLTEITSHGYHGWHEGFVPTVLSHYNYTLDTIFDQNSNAKYFDDTKVDVKHKHTKINWSWL
jgi:hypothetical protein